MEFGTGYYHPMDRDYGSSRPADNSTNDVGVGIKDIGMSVGLGPTPNIPAVQAKIRTGTKSFELAFMGAGKGSGQAHTPGMYGKLQRQALEEISRSSQVDFTTHSSVGIMGLAGMDQQGNFSKANRNFSIHEIKRAIEFAADVARGGNVVVHTGEFQRSLSEAEWNQQGKWAGKFESHKEEPELATFRVVDNRTGALISEARKNRKVARPVWKIAEDDYTWTDTNTGKSYKVHKGDYIDYEGNRVDRAERVPDYDERAGHFRTEMSGWNDFVKDSREMTVEARRFWKETPKNNKSAWEKSPWSRFQEVESEEEIEVKPEEAYIIATLETNAANSRGWAYYYGGQFKEHVDELKRLRKAEKVYQQIEHSASEEEKVRLNQEVRGILGTKEEELPSSQFIRMQIDRLDTQIKQGKEAASAQWAQAEEAMETMRHVQSAETYGLKQAFEGYAEAGLTAMEASNKLEKQGKLKQPIFVAMENIFPESYGAHPDELIRLVEGGREQMAEMLKNKGYSEKEARKEAEEHIKGHFDTGHMNMWRKYWKGSDKDFDRWFLDKVEEMAKKKIVGSVHLVDNYGYQDEHLAPGEGNTPVRQAVEILKKHGYKGPLVVEPGADYTTDLGGFQSVMKTWKLFGSPVYGATPEPGAGRSRKWTEVQYSYFGQTQPPYFVFGGYSPSEEWTLWSGVPME